MYILKYHISLNRTCVFYYMIFNEMRYFKTTYLMKYIKLYVNLVCTINK